LNFVISIDFFIKQKNDTTKFSLDIRTRKKIIYIPLMEYLSRVITILRQVGLLLAPAY